MRLVDGITVTTRLAAGRLPLVVSLFYGHPYPVQAQPPAAVACRRDSARGVFVRLFDVVSVFAGPGLTSAAALPRHHRVGTDGRLGLLVDLTSVMVCERLQVG